MHRSLQPFALRLVTNQNNVTGNFVCRNLFIIYTFAGFGKRSGAGNRHKPTITGVTPRHHRVTAVAKARNRQAKAEEPVQAGCFFLAQSCFYSVLYPKFAAAATVASPS